MKWLRRYYAPDPDQITDPPPDPSPDPIIDPSPDPDPSPSPQVFKFGDKEYDYDGANAYLTEQHTNYTQRLEHISVLEPLINAKNEGNDAEIQKYLKDIFGIELPSEDDSNDSAEMKAIKALQKKLDDGDFQKTVDSYFTKAAEKHGEDWGKHDVKQFLLDNQMSYEQTDIAMDALRYNDLKANYNESVKEGVQAELAKLRERSEAGGLETVGDHAKTNSGEPTMLQAAAKAIGQTNY